MFNISIESETFLESKNYIERALINRKETFDINFATTPNEIERYKTFYCLDNKQDSETNKNKTNNYNLNSPYKFYFKTMIDQFENRINKMNQK